MVEISDESKFRIVLVPSIFRTTTDAMQLSDVPMMSNLVCLRCPGGFAHDRYTRKRLRVCSTQAAALQTRNLPLCFRNPGLRNALAIL